MNIREFERIKTWNRQHPDQHYSSLNGRGKKQVMRGEPVKEFPLILRFFGWFAVSIWRIISRSSF